MIVMIFMLFLSGISIIFIENLAEFYVNGLNFMMKFETYAKGY
jgi:hypothetical protein